mgnify:CR=1 FL=1
MLFRSYEKDRIEAIAALSEQRRGFNNALLAEQFAIEAQARADAEVDVFKRTLPGQLLLAGMRGGGGAQANQMMNQKAIGARVESLTRAIKTAEGGKYARGIVSSELSTLVDKMDPMTFMSDAYGPNQNGLGVMNFLEDLYKVRNSETRVRSFLKKIPQYRDQLSNDSPFHEVYDFFAAIDSRSGSKDPAEMIGKIMGRWEAPMFQTTNPQPPGYQESPKPELGTSSLPSL